MYSLVVPFLAIVGTVSFLIILFAVTSKVDVHSKGIDKKFDK